MKDAPEDIELSDTKPHPGRRMTEAEFVEWSDAKTWAEWADGEVIVKPSVSLTHARLASFLIHLVGDYAEDKNLGEVFTVPVQVRFATQRRRRAPDIIFVSGGREEIYRAHHVEGAPDLIVEIVSPSDPARDWREKYFEYERAGVREYWIVDPANEKLAVYTLGRDGKYREVRERDGQVRSRVLRGFYLKPAWLWKERPPKARDILREITGHKH